MNGDVLDFFLKRRGMKKRQPHPWLDKQCSLVVTGKHSESYFLGLSPSSVLSTNVKITKLSGSQFPHL